MPELAVAVTVLPGKLEEWLRFVQELDGARRPEYEAARRRLGIRRERVWLTQVGHLHVAVVLADVDAPDRVVSTLAGSSRPFDRWFKRRIRELHGLDLAYAGSELVFPACGDTERDRRESGTGADDEAGVEKGGE